jgi:hypothetical protein
VTIAMDISFVSNFKTNKNMKIKLFSILFFCSIYTMNAQDIIIKTNTDEIECKIIEIEDSKVKYRKYSNLKGPIYNINKSEIFMIKYENGDKDVFKDLEIIETEQETITKNKPIVNEEKKIPQRTYALKFGLGIGNIFNTTLVSNGTVTTNVGFPCLVPFIN